MQALTKCLIPHCAVSMPGDREFHEICRAVCANPIVFTPRIPIFFPTVSRIRHSLRWAKQFCSSRCQKLGYEVSHRGLGVFIDFEVWRSCLSLNVKLTSHPNLVCVCLHQTHLVWTGHALWILLWLTCVYRPLLHTTHDCDIGRANYEGYKRNVADLSCSPSWGVIDSDAVEHYVGTVLAPICTIYSIEDEQYHRDY